jgi:uncharacterized membrane protein YozB (DUF420 family)
MISVFQIDLVFQILIFAILAAGMFVEGKRKIKAHAQLMLAAVLLNLASFVVVMGPAWDNVGEGTSSSLSLIAMGHVGLGTLAFLLSFWLVGVWLLSPWLAKTFKIYCYGNLNKKLMWVVLILWLTSLILGVFLYVMVNTGFFGSFSVSPAFGDLRLLSISIS